MQRKMSDPLFIDCLRNEKPMDSALNSAHRCNRKTEKHLKYGRYDDALKYNKETVEFLTKAITESTISTNIENLKLQRKHHENMQRIISRQKDEFEDFLRRNGLKANSKPSNQQTNQESKENQERSQSGVNDAIDDNFKENDDTEFFSLIGGNDLDEEFFSIR